MQVIPAGLQTEFEKTNSLPERIFTYRGVDKTAYVKSFSSVSRRADTVTAGNVSIEINNSDGSWSDILVNPANHLGIAVADSTVQIGYTAISFLTLFTGLLDSANLSNVDTVSLTFRDPISRFSEMKVGSSTTPADYYSAASYTVFGSANWSAGRNPAHLIWHILTVWGGLDSTAGAGNPDIDWAKFLEFRTILDSINLKIQAKIEGDSITSVLQKICEMTLSSVFSESDGKIVCRYWLGQDNTSIQTFTTAKYKYLPTVDIDRTDIVNKHTVRYGYNPTLETWGGSISRNDGTSETAYGTIEKLYEDTSVWYYDSPSAIDFAERMLLDTKNPIQYVEFESFLLAYRQQLWDALKITDAFYSWTNQGFRIEGLNFDTNSGTVGISGRLTTLYPFLILDDPVNGAIDSIYILA